MIAFLCHFYGWTYHETVNLPLKLFFLFFREGTKMEARQYRESLDIAATPMMKIEYYKILRGRYNQMINPRPSHLPEKPPEYYVQADSDQARELIFNVFKKVKRSAGYG